MGQVRSPINVRRVDDAGDSGNQENALMKIVEQIQKHITWISGFSLGISMFVIVLALGIAPDSKVGGIVAGIALFFGVVVFGVSQVVVNVASYFQELKGIRKKASRGRSWKAMFVFHLLWNWVLFILFPLAIVLLAIAIAVLGVMEFVFKWP